MLRRDFAKSTMLGLAATAALPIAARAQKTDPNENILFTESDPGHWAKVVALHIPQTTVAAGKLTIKTPHPQSEAHYIVSHTVILADGTYLGRKTFTYKDEPVSEHTLPAGYTGKVTVTSTCNQHDWWVKSLSV
jgi:superoxide reductase